VARWLLGEAGVVANAHIISQLRPTSMSMSGGSATRSSRPRRIGIFSTPGGTGVALGSLQHNERVRHSNWQGERPPCRISLHWSGSSSPPRSSLCRSWVRLPVSARRGHRSRVNPWSSPCNSGVAGVGIANVGHVGAAVGASGAAWPGMGAKAPP